MTNKDVYPITAAFEEKMSKKVSGLDGTYRVFDVMREVIGEYEHGSVDVDEFFEKLLSLRAVVMQDSDDDREVQREMVKVYANVCEDILMTLIHSTGKEQV